ncbi:glycosyltransferase family 2 protein [Oscillatoria sp. FACHB-1407]|uniref:hormogonium polysaccharide biosynthesis glycosyltransferase HpsE n=1 Tax=Oscillatoria sp. FACHB-1407 TaxID=2692847 RepID=UPI0016829C0A|nr:hormogonium polysaccharide biosynthesis glycosyltransferase HpsE [Oscillatoria sp. FACHB-1407]MBD2464473.1 glycosyltransferase family 2 protein [Oscillatoria sp. FACHB-1407]
MVDFTVAICTFNGEKRLPQVLEQLKAQIQTETIFWEVIVIDNNSTDKTADVVRDYQRKWIKNCHLIYCRELKQGLAFARQRAILSAKSNLVGFLDDDNLPSLDWVSQAYQFAQNHPEAGAFGSQIHGDFEKIPPKNFKKIASFLAIVERGEKAFIYEPKRRMLPPGAGLVVRREAWQNHVPKKLLLKGRVNQSMLASEDLEAICYIQNAGWQIWYNPTMHVQHKIPGSRLEPKYLIPLIRGVGLARFHIRMTRTAVWQKPLMPFVYLMNDLRKTFLYFLKYRNSIKTDLIVACEWEFLCSSLISPFYLLKHWINSHLSRYSDLLDRSQLRLNSADQYSSGLKG